MGFSYERTSSGRMSLCCDACGKAGARKYRCPYGYCYPVALCKECKSGEPGRDFKRYHVENDCKGKHEAYAAACAEHDRRIAAGEFLRCSAYSGDCPKGWVEVTFRGSTGERVRYMPLTSYHAVDKRDTTEADYAALGPVLEAPPAG